MFSSDNIFIMLIFGFFLRGTNWPTKWHTFGNTFSSFNRLKVILAFGPFPKALWCALCSAHVLAKWLALLSKISTRHISSWPTLSYEKLKCAIVSHATLIKTQFLPRHSLKHRWQSEMGCRFLWSINHLCIPRVQCVTVPRSEGLLQMACMYIKWIINSASHHQKKIWIVPQMNVQRLDFKLQGSCFFICIKKEEINTY